MKKTIDGINYDSERNQCVAHFDSADNLVSTDLRRIANGDYFLHHHGLQVCRQGVWRDHPLDGSAVSFPRSTVRNKEAIVPLSEGQAIDWFVDTHAPECLKSRIKELIGKLIVIDLGELAEPLDRYCEEHKVTREQACDRAVLEYVVNKRTGKERALK